MNIKINSLTCKFFMLKKTLLYLLFSLPTIVLAQSIGVGTTTPETSAILDVKSTTKGFLMPRMNTIQRDAIVNPTQGLQIYNTDDRCHDTYDGSKWAKSCDMKMNGASFPANGWVSKSGFGVIGRAYAVGFSINNKGYIGTGFDGSFKADFWEYDPSLNVWTQKANFGGGARESAIGFSINNKGYIGTGSDGNNLKSDFWEYDPNLNTWTQKRPFGIRYIAVGFSIGDKGYLGTGYDGSVLKKDFWEYNATLNTWTQKADFGGTARDGAVGFSIGNKGYLGTGKETGNVRKKDFWEYNPDLNTWTEKANFGGTARDGAVGFSIADKGYIGTGSFTKDFWEYNPNVNFWIKNVDFEGAARDGAIGFSIADKGYIGTGTDGTFSSSPYKKDFWEYLPTGGKEYSQNIPSDALVYKGHAWTSSGNNLYTTLENVNTTTRGFLNADGGLRTKHSGSIVRTITAGNSNVTLNITPIVPSTWDFTNTMVAVSVVDDPLLLRAKVYSAKLTSPSVITLEINAQAAGIIRFNYIIFKL
jgi:hypothetical protein